MALRLPDRWLWDFWLARDGGDHHLFFLQAPRRLGDPERRHAHATIGHAVSSDLVSWELLPDALGPGALGSWDDGPPWTGSVIRHDGRWLMLYTGTSSSEHRLVQRIGAACSDDLVRWARHPANPVLAVDPRWYEPLDLGAWHDQAWRDPWLFHHPGTGELHALITARAATGPRDSRGVVAHAWSRDVATWEVGPPIVRAQHAGELEVPQLVSIGRHWYLLFSVPARSHGRSFPRRTGRRPRTATYYLSSDDPLGPFAPPLRPVVAPGADTLYAGKLVEAAPGDWRFLAARLQVRGGSFAGELIDPRPVGVDAAGHLSVGG